LNKLKIILLMIILTPINNPIKIYFIKKTKSITICRLINHFSQIIKKKEIIIYNQYLFNKLKVIKITIHNF
jgi:hypothetical protein